MSDDQVDRHLAECAACRSWQYRASELSRALRVRPVEPTPDLVSSVVEAATPLRDRFVRRWPRVLLACVAVGQMVLGAAQVLGMDHSAHGGSQSGTPTGHLFSESTAWNLALGLGLLWCAWRVRASSGLLPVLSAFLVVLTGLSIHDVIEGAVPASRLATHGLLVAGLVLLLVVRRDQQRWAPEPGHAQASDDDENAPGGPEHPAGDQAGPPRQGSRRHLGPTGYRRAG